MQTGWRLERTYLTGAGFPESRLEGLSINWSDPFEPTGHAALWADNGTGKTTITALRFGLYLPHARDFIRGESDRSLAKLVRSGDVCHVVEQATRVVDGELQRIVMGMVTDWADGGTQDVDNPRRLQRDFYGWVTYGSGPTIQDLPFRTSVGRRATHAQFVEAVRGMLPNGGALPPHRPSDHQRAWGDWLAAAGVDVEQLRFQSDMNASEGGVDHVMRFPDSDACVRWLIGATTPTTTVEQIGKSIEVLRANAAARPRWSDELTLWESLTEPLLRLAIAHDQVAVHRRAVATAEVNAAAVVADSEATLAALDVEEANASEKHEEHERLRREAGATARRAQAHRLRMRLRAAELRATVAAALADKRRSDRDRMVRELAGWRLVQDVLDANTARSHLAGLKARLEAAEKHTSELREEEQRHLHALARLLTDHRDRAADDHRAAKEQRGRAATALATAQDEQRKAVAAHATAGEQLRRVAEQITESERILSEAVTTGLLREGADPVMVEAGWTERAATALRNREAADQALKAADKQADAQQKTMTEAQNAVVAAQHDVENGERQLQQVNDRVRALEEDERVQDAVGDSGIELWTARSALTDALSQRAETADRDAAEARTAVGEARRTLDAVGADGLLPASALVEEAVRRCQDADVPAWPGWRWLADTMSPQAAQSFASARPDIASGVVVSHPDHFHRALDAIDDLDTDTAVWVGAVLDSEAAVSPSAGDHSDGTLARVLLPHPGTYDREAAGDMIAAAENALTSATLRLHEAGQRATDARSALAALTQFWKDLPEDPRTAVQEKIRSAQVRREAARSDEQTAADALQNLTQLKQEHQAARDAAQELIDRATEKRRLLIPVTSAADTLSGVRAKLPGLRTAEAEHRRRVDQLGKEIPALTTAAEQARDQVRVHARRRDDAADELRSAGLSATTDGTIPTDDAPTIRARLKSVTSALEDAAVDPELRQRATDARQLVADLDAKLDADIDLRHLAERFASTDDTRHPVALATATRQAEHREAEAREEYAKASQAAETAKREHQRQAEERADRSSPDIEGFPSADLVAEADEADGFADQLDELAAQSLLTQRSAEQLARNAENAATAARQSAQLVEASVGALRYLTDPVLTGRRADDIAALTTRISAVSERVRESRKHLTDSEQARQREASAVRAHANSPQARKVEAAEDSRVIDLISRLRGDEQLPAEAERIAGELEQRAVSLRDDLDRHDRDVHTCAVMLHVQASRALDRLRAYQNQSRLPDGLGEWSERRFVVIEHEKAPADESVAIDRVARIVHALLTPGAGRSDAQSLLFAATRALVDAPFRVRLLKPHIDLSLDRVDVAELKNFSGGQRVTAGVLLYATMTKVRALSDTTSVGWLWLDNPFGQASADQFVRTMRRAADQLGLQLLFTAAPKDKGALSMFDRTIMLGRRSRPSSGEKVVVVDDQSRELTDLVLVQRDVRAVLGE
ncbi:hypothetical protein JIX56_21540 [Streptomyces sp. CA-210063]|uniref:hypothetical protein n=1 Tax=Streptomyces sp. CA-210063 TaxID=2801029 RepID=UPI00214B2133|nr:hypothetical protein [Streptomyces sp. CA-210063]UUU32282.1 hypothetical protein JIX56_21540 [Streptomyces sp. CA-210063]